MGGQQGDVARQGHATLDQLQALGDQFLGAAVVAVVKIAQLGRWDFLQGLQGGPFFEKVGGHAATEFLAH